MKDYIREIIDKNLSQNDNENRLREYIQKYILFVIYRKKIYQNVIFTGGTALRFLYKLRKYSENLDFSISEKSRHYDFLNILEVIKKELILSGYKVDIKYSIDKTVHSAFFRFPELLYEYGLSPHRNAKISIKLKIDTNPPSGSKQELSLYNSTFLFYILHYDLPSLFSGKLHALLCREYTKGRDWYDLLWYLTNIKDLEPNLIMLKRAIKQTCKRRIEIVKGNWKQILKQEIDELDIEEVKKDVKPFLENHNEIEFLNKKSLYQILEKD